MTRWLGGEGRRKRKGLSDEGKRTSNKEEVGVCILFFARCCLGKISDGAPFSQLHKGDKRETGR